ncbi:TIGR02530 family flagellar biosynthesis protein [Halobacillus sp. A5]|uniref:TIGR02530 family flagellar biosynthesis protein n=1 Tax=Halobacillus sp. A5 TaxID=2880263 RepID=UPI0020A6681C|nr:TIGR02530 family flagellar biosynthesis protein [Halobacillus sp. A5]MCP3026117.1 flagellar protein [Halobacillus sp. A5]
MDPRIHQVHQPLPVTNTKKFQSKTNTKFEDVLKEASGLHLSKHAEKRLKDRNIKIDDQQWKQISKKVHEAKNKGVTDSLVILNDSALVVSNKNNTVVTAMNKEESKSQIFTNINGTIILE